MSLRAVIDTNVIVSAALTPDGHPDLVVRLALASGFQLVASNQILLEYTEVLTRPAFRLPLNAVRELISALRARALVVAPDEIAKGICSDPDDTFVLGTAVAGKADYIITGNVKHFPSSHKGVAVITPRAFLVRVQQG